MGSYCQLYISDYPVFSSSSYVSPAVMTMFRESDKKIYNRHFGERNKIEWGHVDPEDDNYEEVVEYREKAKYVKQRLDIIGFNIERVKREFNEVKVLEVEKLKELSEDDEHNLWTKEIEILNTSTFEDYLTAFKTIMNSNIHPVYYIGKNPDSSPLIKYILEDNEEFYWSFPCNDFRCFLRALLEVSPDNTDVIQDITDLVNSGYYQPSDKVCHLSLEELIGDYATSSKIIVLTEGSTDTEFLKGSLKLLYPHLYDYFTFMDFGFRPPGGLGPLVNAVKSFAGAGIENRIIALFDNDTAAYSAIDSLKDIGIPNNIVITHYPDIEIAESYPAIGPNGQTMQNINRLACSIELYLGSDILKQDGEYIPIQWKGYDKKIKRYQGELLNKKEIQGRFREKIARCFENNTEVDNGNWDEMRKIFLHIFGVFSA